LQEQISVLQKTNAEAQIASQRLNEFRTAYKNKQEQLEELRALLPEQRELTKVLEGIQDRAHTTGLSVRKFMPKDDLQQDFYSGKRIDVSVQSSFAGLRSFFDQMAHYQRIVSITNFEIKQMDKQASNKTVEARFDLTAYYVSSEKLQKQAANQPNQMPANPAGAATQAAQQAAAPPK
jgi:Tfp pilus assembly protein PilO